MFSSVDHTFRSLPLVMGPWDQVLLSMNCEIRMDTNMVHVYENNEDVVTEKPMNFSHVRLPQFIDEFDLIGIMIAGRPLKASCWRSLSLESN